MRFGNIGKAAPVIKGGVGSKGRISTALKPALESFFAFPCLQHLNIVISARCKELPPSGVSNKPGQYSAAVEATVFIIPRGNDDIFELERNKGSQRGERIKAAVYVTHC